LFLAGLKTGGRTPWSYRSGTSFLHACPGGVKLLFLLALSAFPLAGLPAAGGAAAFVFLCAALARIRPWELFAGSRFLLVTLAALTAARALRMDPVSFNAEGMAEGLRFTAGVLVSFAAASLFFAVTTTTELRRSLETVELFFRFPANPQNSRRHGRLNSRRRGRLSLALALMLGFLPRFFELWENAETAVKARACSGGIKRITAILPLVTERMLEAAAETAEALEARGLTL
jgi:energy-coupling factor transporter transmembrane protein EcfT